MGMKATRHNGRAGKFGAYNVKHNDRNFDVSNSEHIDVERVKGNIYWDCYQGYSFPGMEDNRKYTFSEIEREFYYENYHEFVDGQNLRNREARHTDRHKTIDGILENTKTCPEETILQLGNIDATVDAPAFAKVAAEYFAEFQKRYGEFPKQEKALVALGFEMPHPKRKKSKTNNRKVTFDEELRKLFIEIAEKNGVTIEKEPLTGKNREDGMMNRKIDREITPALLDIAEFCDYLGIGETKARELLHDPKNGFVHVTMRVLNSYV